MFYVRDVERMPSKGSNNAMSSIESDFIDNEIYNETISDIGNIKKTLNEKNEETPFFNKLGQDLFNSLYKLNPKMRSYDDMASSMKMEHQILNELIDNDYFRQLRRNTVGDIFNSTYGLNLYQKEAYKAIKEWTKASKENENLMKMTNDILYDQKTLEQLLAKLQDDPNNIDLKKKAEELKNIINQKNQNFNPQNQQQTQSQAKSLQDLKNQLNNATQNVNNTIDNINNGFDNFFDSNTCAGGTEGGNLQFVSYEDKIILARELMHNHKLKEISDQLGKMKKMLSKINKKPSKIGYELCDITLGNKINKCISSEKLLLSEEGLENNFYKKYMNKSLMQYDVKGTQEMQGPIVVCLDDSGSMDGDRDSWAKAIAIAMLQLAIKQKRNYRCIIFSNGVDAVYDFDRTNYDPNKVLQMASFFNGGGTNFLKPLRKAVESIEESKYRKADILFITDGSPDSNLPESFYNKLISLKSEKDFMIQGIVIGGSSNKYMAEFCDKVTTFRDLNKDNDLSDIFAKVKINEDRSGTNDKTS